LPDGNIVCLGRTDNQVKVRGFRIELGEIESALERHPAVRKAVLTTQEDGGTGKELVAFWVGKDSERDSISVSESDLRRFLNESLPAYMVPTAWQRVSEFPLTPNGKIDRKRLPKITLRESAAQERSIEPQTSLELEIAESWKKLLKLREVGLTDDFFALGGHSLLAMRLVGGLRTKYKIDLSVGKFFQEPTIKALAAHVEKLVKAFAENHDKPARQPAEGEAVTV